MPQTCDRSPLSLWTFGYEGLDIDSFIVRLNQEAIRTIVDVRELPLSRKKGFSKSAFASALAASGIGYVHVPALGCPRPIRDQYRRDADWTSYSEAFLSYLQGQRAAVRELAAFARTIMVCLVCFEEDYNFCHRTFVARAARRAGAPDVRHLTAKTTVFDRSTHRSA